MPERQIPIVDTDSMAQKDNVHMHINGIYSLCVRYRLVYILCRLDFTFLIYSGYVLKIYLLCNNSTNYLYYDTLFLIH